MKRTAYLLLALAAACSGDGGGGGGGGGSVNVQIIVPAPPATDPFLGLDALKITVNGPLVVTTAWFGPSDPLVLEDITPGSGYSVGLEGFILGTRVSRGRTKAFNFVEGANATAILYFARVRTFNAVRDPQTVPVREGASAAMFSDGTVLVAGGYVGGTAVGSADLYFPDEDEIRPIAAAMLAPHAYAVTVALGNDRVLIAGGRDAADAPSAAADVFQYTAASDSGTWATGVPPMSTARRDAAGGKLADGIAVVAGGEPSAGNPLDSSEVFDFGTGPGAWTLGPVMQDLRRGPVGLELSPGVVLIGGGFDNNGSGGSDWSARTDIFTWTGTIARANGSNLRRQRELAGVAPLGGGSWALFGGYRSALAPEVEVVTVNGAGTDITSQDESDLPSSQQRGGGVRLGDGRVLFVGGDDTTGSPPNPLDRLGEFDVANGTTTGVTPTLGPTATAAGFDPGDGTTIVVIDGRVYRYSPDIP